MITINRKRAKAAFEDYVNHYNSEDEKVRLKIEHTYRVSGLCDRIAASLKLSKEDKDLAWLIGLLHDIGRFEQLKNYGTFLDADSIDHAALGADILFGQGKIRDYVEETGEDELIQTAIRCHNAFRIPSDLDQRTEIFCNIIRDADKVDILKVNVEFSFEEIYNVSTAQLRKEAVTDKVMESFEEEHAVLRSMKMATVDYIVGHISLVFELVFPISLKLVQEQGYLEELMNFTSDNPVTQKQFARIREKMREYMAERQ